MKYSFEIITWDDHYGTHARVWETDTYIQKEANNSHQVISAGWIVFENKHKVISVPEYSIEMAEPGKVNFWQSPTVILKAAIVKRKKIKL